MSRYRKEQSPTAFITVVVLHVAVIAALIYYQPSLSNAKSDLMFVDMITPPQVAPVVQAPEPKPKQVVIKPVQKTITPPPPLQAPSPTAINVAPPPPAPAEAVESVAVAASPEPPAPPAPLVLPRFDAAYLQNPAPTYPQLSRRAGEQGKVLLRVVVRPDGTPESVELRQTSGVARLDQAAMEAVRKWRFVPARRGDTPVASPVIVPIVFSLES